MLALVGFDEGAGNLGPGPGIELHSIAEDVVALFDEIESVLNDIADRFVRPTLSHFPLTPCTVPTPFHPLPRYSSQLIVM
jgi:hypothetical protein